MAATGSCPTHHRRHSADDAGAGAQGAQQPHWRCSCRHDAAQQMIDYSGLRVFRLRPNRAVVVLMLMHYLDSDLGQYRYGTNAWSTRRAKSRRTPGRTVGGRLHPTTCPSTGIHAGPARTIWGYRRCWRTSPFRDSLPVSGFDVSRGDRLIADGMEFRRSADQASSRRRSRNTSCILSAASSPDHRRSRLTGVHISPGGARICGSGTTLRPWLAALGLPSLHVGSADNVEMTFLTHRSRMTQTLAAANPTST